MMKIPDTASLQADLFDLNANPVTVIYGWVKRFSPALSLRFVAIAGRHSLGRGR